MNYELFGIRISVQLILEWIASGASVTDIVSEFSHISVEAVQEAILYASRFADQEILIEIKGQAA